MLTCGWVWLYIGALLMLMELMSPGFVLFFFGLSAATVGVLRLLFGEAVSPTVQMVAFSAFSVIYLVFLRRWGKSVFAGDKENEGAGLSSGNVGRRGTTTERIAPPCPGRVMIGDAEWTAEADVAIEAGVPVTVVAQENLTLKVAPVSGGAVA
jgi:membrane protein implicated in regulation of membrane protease activity